jgi:hypothetical protein
MTLVSASCSVQLASQVKPTSAGLHTAGGTRYMLRMGPAVAWDGQRLSVGADMAFAGRVFQRTLTARAPATRQGTLPDSAFATVRADKDPGASSAIEIFSNGPFGTVDLAAVSVR